MCPVPSGWAHNYSLVAVSGQSRSDHILRPAVQQRPEHDLRSRLYT
jgi:hypothetical protein